MNYIIVKFDQLFETEVKEEKTQAISFENLLKKFTGQSSCLIVPVDVYSLIYETEITGIEYSGAGIKYYFNGKEWVFALRTCDVSFVYDEKELLNSLFVKEIRFDSDKKQVIEDTVSLSVPFSICIACDFSNITNRFYITSVS